MHKMAEKYLSEEEYLELEEFAEYKSEQYQGEIFGLAGSSINHNQIIMNIGSRLNQAQERHNCRTFASDLRLWIEEIDLFTYPDLMVTCDKPSFYPVRNDTVLNPMIIIEVLLKSTEAYLIIALLQFNLPEG